MKQAFTPGTRTVNPRRTTPFMALLAAVLFASCVPDIDLAGSAWSGDAYTTDDEGQTLKTTLTLVCNTADSGLLFVAEDDGGPWPLCYTMPMNYSWTDNHGTATATLAIPDAIMQRYRLDLDYTKAEGLRITAPTTMSTDLELPGIVNFGLKKKHLAKPATLVETTWKQGHYNEWNGDSIVYELHLVGTTTGVLNVTVVDIDGHRETERANVSYSYHGGAGTVSATDGDESVSGGFYLPDDNHLFFALGDFGLTLTKQ